MRILYKGKAYGSASNFNMASLNEVIVGFEEGDMDSCFVSDLGVFIEKTKSWKSLKQAFKDRDVITDNYNSYFFEPQTEEDRERGFTL